MSDKEKTVSISFEKDVPLEDILFQIDSRTLLDEIIGRMEKANHKLEVEIKHSSDLKQIPKMKKFLEEKKKNLAQFRKLTDGLW